MPKMIAHGLIASALTAAFAVSAVDANVAAEPMGIAGSNESVPSPIDEARVFCFNRASGRFLHWGACTGGPPRVYCRNRWTGRFLHWGAC